MATCPCGREIRAKVRVRQYCSQACYVEGRRALHLEEARSGLRRCSRCCAEKSLAEFSPGNGPLGRHGWCKWCRAEDERIRRLTPERVSRHAERYRGDMLYRSEQLVGAVKKRARRAGVAFDLTPEWLASKLEIGRCEVTGLPFVMAVRDGRPGPFSPSIDRISPAAGYTVANCRVVLMALNIAMSDWGLDPILKIAEALTLRGNAVSA